MKIIVAHTIKAPLHRPNQNQRSSSVQRARGSRPEPESRTSNLPKLLGPVQAQFLAVASPRGNWPGASHGPARNLRPTRARLLSLSLSLSRSPQLARSSSSHSTNDQTTRAARCVARRGAHAHPGMSSAELAAPSPDPSSLAAPPCISPRLPPLRARANCSHRPLRSDQPRTGAGGHSPALAHLPGPPLARRCALLGPAHGRRPFLDPDATRLGSPRARRK